ncbi:ABC transporter substrate-binding protein [Marinobacterium mangrovicola]|uniref:Amino acid/amide ABC transporter substrate-binding protein (HAAT family) n=1 Tax=Marinobacterium mangrovicola TaxID=1476959 RepID=A0A4R1GIP1_9GAMM|nr:ABC transporter substrate-binding protein [Marinobacterium mangrovicola]TCK06973.1 amino acid/amide ABC transporter substrate-binding protein (HAAT family) [Marinobacterium mangrovicola]
MKKVAIAAALTLGAFNVANVSAETVKVGMLLPYSGVYAALGNEIEAGFNLGLQEFGPDLDIEIVKEDSEADPGKSLAKARKLVLQDKVDVMTGIVSSAVAGALRDFVHGAKVPLMVTNAGNDSITGSSCSPYISRFSFSNSQVNGPMGQWVYDQGITKVYTMAPDYTAGHEMIEAFTKTFEAAGGQVVGSEYTPFRKTKDFGPYLAKAKSSGAEAIYTFYAGGEAISFVKQYDSFGLKSSLPLMGSGFLTSPLYVNAEGPAAIGVKTVLHYVPTIDSDMNNSFVQKFQQLNEGRSPSEYSVAGYDAAHALALAIKGGADDRESIAAAISKVSFTGPRGEVHIDPASNNIVQPLYVYETVAEGDGLTQKVLAQLPTTKAPADGCSL